MEIKCTVEELKKLMENKTPVGGTTDVLNQNQLEQISNFLAQKY